MVVGSMVGAGVFSLPAQFAASTGVAGTLIAWAIAGGGMLMLAFVFQFLAARKPDLDAGVYAYAKAGFGDYPGFLAAFGYWASACAGNVFYWVFIMTTLGAIFPGLGKGDTVLAVALSSVGLWIFFFLIRRGAREAAALNRVVTIAKVVPILVFILLCIFAFKPDVFAANWGGADYAGSLFDQVRTTMLVTVFAFIGVEGASVYSRHARSRRDVGRATVLGFLAVLSIFASVTIVSYGILPMDQIAELRQPSMGGVLEAAVGTWGAVLIGVGLIVSILGAYLAWTMMAAEVLLAAARQGDLPLFLRRTNAHDVPIASLAMSTLLVQVMLVVTIFSYDAFNTSLSLTSSLILVPFFLTAAYALKLTLSRSEASVSTGRRTAEIATAISATAYTAFLLIGADVTYLLLACIVLAPATILYVMGRREQRARTFTPIEWIVFAVVLAGAVTGIVGLSAGWLTA
ncbi:amino acid permease [Microbacterium ulmi]|uniref:Amino acid permease n=2 Tax=Microbacterium ulmi TaxID=179095 RepID=A0A7Y2PZH2_9MICO|nr:amino acid permease [Microbacterium ulmi]